MRGNFVAIAMLSMGMLAGAETSTFAGDNKTRGEADQIVVLHAADPTPAMAERVKTVELGGYKGYSSYFEIVSQAKELARQNQANIVKITDAVAARGASKPVHAILYKTGNAGPSEKEFSWNKSRRLTWDDFRGGVPKTAVEENVAATVCGIGFETNTITSSDPKLKIHVYNNFYTTYSWVKPGDEDSIVLAHEQGHFDLCELYTRKLRERFNSVSVNVKNLRSQLGSIYKQVQREYEKRQEQYENETEHGVVLQEQERWQEMLARELSASEGWME